MFSFNSHLNMLADRNRVESFRTAIFETVREGDIVVDIGAGTGIMSFFALQAGARRVYAIESGEIIEVAEKTAKENGFGDRIVFIPQDSFKAEIPDLADVLISETVGSFGIDENIVRILSDGRKRFLKKSGRIIPKALNLFAVPVFFNKNHPFLFLENSYCDINYNHLITLSENNVFRMPAPSSGQVQFLSQPSSIFDADFYSCEPFRFPLDMSASFELTTDSRCHGIMIFLDINLTEKICISLAEKDRFLSTHWEVIFFPAPKDISLIKGDALSFDLALTDKNGFVWKYACDKNGKRLEVTQLSAFGVPSLKHLVQDT